MSTKTSEHTPERPNTALRGLAGIETASSAHARLVIAAPALLEALEKIKPFLEECVAEMVNPSEGATFVEAARAAIRAAREGAG